MLHSIEYYGVAKTGYSLFLELKSIEQQAETFIRLANNPELRIFLGKNARKRVKDHFSIDVEARRLLEILTS